VVGHALTAFTPIMTPLHTHTNKDAHTTHFSIHIRMHASTHTYPTIPIFIQIHEHTHTHTSTHAHTNKRCVLTPPPPEQVTEVSIEPTRVAVKAEVFDHRNVVPRGSRFDINQLGLVPEAFLDIGTPGDSESFEPVMCSYDVIVTSHATPTWSGQRVEGQLRLCRLVRSAGGAFCRHGQMLARGRPWLARSRCCRRGLQGGGRRGAALQQVRAPGAHRVPRL
jgi:hypothetical protein